jgi:glycosyltransferase involved in cell wall biosynthesis
LKNISFSVERLDNGNSVSYRCDVSSAEFVSPFLKMACKAKRILNVQLLGSGSSQENCEGFSTDFVVLGTENTRALLVKSFLLPKRLSEYDLIITNEYFSSFGVNLRLLLTGCRSKHVTIGLNQSRRLLQGRIRWINRVINRVFNRSDLVVVHSRREIELFEKTHKISRSRFYFSLWGFDLPHISVTQFSNWPRKYICSVGRNNRDFASFCQACDGLESDGIIVTSNYENLPQTMPSNIHVFRELSTNETLDCIKNAEANVILLKDNSRGAGHITAVAAMFAGTPQIVSNADVLEDYLIDGISAVSVPVGDITEIRTAIRRVISEADLQYRLSTNAQAYATQWLTHKSASNRICVALRALLAGDRLVTVDSSWLNIYETLKAKGREA